MCIRDRLTECIGSLEKDAHRPVGSYLHNFKQFHVCGMLFCVEKEMCREFGGSGVSKSTILQRLVGNPLERVTLQGVCNYLFHTKDGEIFTGFLAASGT